MQTQWLRFMDDVRIADFTWKSMLTCYSDRLLKFIINMRANTLPSPDNLRRWDRKGTLWCGLCTQAHATLAHILCGCPWVRRQNIYCFEDRYPWRHNGVLTVLMNHIAVFILHLQSKPPRKLRCSIKFRRAGQKPRVSTSLQKLGILDQARDWTLDCDLPELHSKANPYIIPHHVVLTDLKVDSFIISEETKIIIFIEVTSPNDENMAK